MRPPPASPLFPYTTLFRSGRLHVAQGLGIDREEAAGRAIFRRHVGDGGAVGEREVLEAGSVELHELVDHARSEEHTSELQSLAYLVCRLLLEKKKVK